MYIHTLLLTFLNHKHVLAYFLHEKLIECMLASKSTTLKTLRNLNWHNHIEKLSHEPTQASAAEHIDKSTTCKQNH